MSKVLRYVPVAIVLITIAILFYMFSAFEAIIVVTHVSDYHGKMGTATSVEPMDGVGNVHIYQATPTMAAILRQRLKENNGKPITLEARIVFGCIREIELK